MAGTTIVVFETLYSDGVEIAAHTDINDEAQTITINPRGGLLIQKTSEDGVLEGFTFLVESEGYSETFTTDGAGTIYIEDLAPGEYTVTEQESELTTRYEIPAGQTVTVTAEEATTVEFYNALLRGKITGHKTGAEQAPLKGVTFSPILANIYLDKLDWYMEQLKAQFDRGKKRKTTFLANYYARNTTRLRKELGETQNPEEQERIAQELRRMELERQTVPYFEPFDPNYRRLQYVRYADDFLIGVIGSKEDALEIKGKVKEFTGSVLHLELSEEKTLITHSAKRARFLRNSCGGICAGEHANARIQYAG